MDCRKCGKKLKKPQRYNRPNYSQLCRDCYLKDPLKGEKIITWKGGRSKDNKGYITVSLSSIKDPNVLEMCKKTVLNGAYGKRRSGRIYEHRMRMVEHIGRPLEKWEVVNHINGDKENNNISNLEITTQQENLKAQRLLVIENRSLREQLSSLQKFLKT